jgi:hypothetical protein
MMDKEKLEEDKRGVERIKKAAKEGGKKAGQDQFKKEVLRILFD